MSSLNLIKCTHCHTPLRLQRGGATTIRCGMCDTVNLLGDPHAIPGVPTPLYHPTTAHTNGYTNNYYPPPPPQPSPVSYAPSPVVYGGKKKAVIVGIVYKNTESELSGSINDAKRMKSMLVNMFKFPESSIYMLTEEETDPYKIPTKHNIRIAMSWLVKGCRPGDSLVFYFSGHGGQQRNYTGDEVTGYDETICPLDSDEQGSIVDDEINETIVKPLVAGVKLHAIIDSCHSGTVLDLPYVCRMFRNGHTAWEDQRPKSGAWKGTSGGEAISFSSCDDDQTSADTNAMSNATPNGAMTFALIKAIEEGQGTTYGNLLSSIRSIIYQINHGLYPENIGFGSNRIGITQEAQLSANERFDVYSKPFSL